MFTDQKDSVRDQAKSVLICQNLCPISDPGGNSISRSLPLNNRLQELCLLPHSQKTTLWHCSSQFCSPDFFVHKVSLHRNPNQRW